MSVIRPKARHLRHSTNPYDDSDTDEEDFSQSRSSIPSRSSLSVSTRREMSGLLRSRDALLLAQMQLEEERRRGKTMLCACIVLGCFCLLLFKDRWPNDVRGALIELLDDGKRQPPKVVDTSPSSSVMNTADAIAHTGSVNDFISQHSTTSSEASSSAGNPGKKSNDGYTLVQDPGKTNSTYSESSTNTTGSNPDFTSNPVDSTASTSPPNLVVAVPSEDEIQQTAQDAVLEELQQHLDNLSKYLKWNLPYKSDRDIPVYWVIPLSGTALLDQVLGKCYGLVQAADRVDLIIGHEEEKILNVITEDDGAKYVNVNLGDLKGIKRAQELRLTNAGVSDVIRSSYLYETALLFQSSARYGKCFTMMRNPIERAVDVFRKLKGTSSNPVFASMTLEEYLKTPYSEDNWMVRFLTNEMEDRLEEHHLDLAKHVLGRKCFVGLTEEFNESMRRFAKYFDWDHRSSNEAVAQCMKELQITQHLTEGEFSLDTMAPKIPTNEYEEGTEVYRILFEKNAMDFELYQYARQLFQRQSLYS